jgi:hypothetical protein
MSNDMPPSVAYAMKSLGASGCSLWRRAESSCGPRTLPNRADAALTWHPENLIALMRCRSAVLMDGSLEAELALAFR